MTTDTYVISANGKATIVKDPQAVLDYIEDWAAWLAGDTIASCAVSCTGCTLQSKGNSSTKVTAWIAGGTAGVEAFAVFSITTAAGRTDQRTIHFKMRER